MPKVPTLEGARIQEGQTNVSRLNVNTPRREAFGGGQSLEGVNRAAGRVGSFAEEIANKEQAKADQIAILDADQKLSELETKMLYDPETGAMNSRGKDSFSLNETLLPDFEEQASNIEKSLNNDHQKVSFRNMMAQRAKHIDKQINRHVSAETKKYDESVTKSYVANEMNAAIQNFHDPERIALSLERQKGTLKSYADRNGIDDETINLMMSETESKTHSSIVSKLMNGGGIRQAQSYYANNKKNISGEDRIRVEKALKAGVLQADSQSLSDNIIAKNPESMKDALAQAREISDPERRDETVRRVKSRFADKRSSEIEDSRQSFEVAYNSIEQNGGDIDSIPKDVWANMEGKKREAIKRISQQMRNGTPVETDRTTYYNLEILASTPETKNKFLRTNLLEIKDKLDESDFEKFSKLQAEMRAGKGGSKLRPILTRNQIVNSVLAENGFETRISGSANKDEVREANQFRWALEQRVKAWQDQNGKEPTNEDIKKMTDQLMVNTIEGKGFFGMFRGEKKLFQRGKDESFFVDTDSIPPGEIEEIKSVLRSRNKPVTEENINIMYTRKLQLEEGDG